MSQSFSKEASDVFELYGRVMYSAQIFEADLKTLLIMAERIARFGEYFSRRNPLDMLRARQIKLLWIECATDIERKLSRTTLGQLIKQKREQIIEKLQVASSLVRPLVPAEMLVEFSRTLDEVPIAHWEQAHRKRDYLAHDFFFSNELVLLTPEGCRTLMLHLQDDEVLFATCINQVRATTEHLVEVSGIDKREFEEAKAAELQRLLDNSK
ncbi:MAG: hypothetical protein E4H01_16050 [Lysobacterales bacterium]|nr:MAG: hypothetical protein E4H01_16050 [Xanthomonadales bacterium]